MAVLGPVGKRLFPSARDPIAPLDGVFLDEYPLAILGKIASLTKPESLELVSRWAAHAQEESGSPLYSKRNIRWYYLASKLVLSNPNVPARAVSNILMRLKEHSPENGPLLRRLLANPILPLWSLEAGGCWLNKLSQVAKYRFIHLLQSSGDPELETLSYSYDI